MRKKSDLLFQWAASMLDLAAWVFMALILIPVGGAVSVVGWFLLVAIGLVALASTAFVGHEYSSAR